MTHDICNIFLAPTRDPHYYQMSLCLMSYISFVYIHCNIKGTESVRQGPCHHGFSQTCQCSKKNSPTHQFFLQISKEIRQFAPLKSGQTKFQICWVPHIGGVKSHLLCGVRIELAIGSLPYLRQAGAPTVWLKGVQPPLGVSRIP